MLCTVVADGSKYFLPPAGEADNLHQSVIPCGDDSVVTVKGDKKYKGVLYCTQCSTPATADDTSTPKAATCDKCASGYFVDTAACTKCHESCLTCADGTPDKCKSCTPETHFLGATGDGPGKCVSCGDATGSGGWTGVTGCAKCTKPNTAGAATCTECTTNYYLKTAGSITSCVADCSEGFFATTVGSVKKCARCSNNANGGIADCGECSLFPYK